jgi:DNA-binding HxlR family transcriptional regulator
MRATIHALADVLFGKGRGAILALLYGHPDQSFYYRQITRQLDGVSDGSLQRELDTLSRLGLIDRTTVGSRFSTASIATRRSSRNCAPWL